MKLQDEHKLFIRHSFETMRSNEEFLALLNFAKIMVYGEKAKPYEQKQINYNSNAKANTKRYIKFSIRKKSGGERIIHAPAKGLKSIQKSLNLIFQNIIDVSPAATGFVPGKSIVDNAKVHAGSIYVYNIDLKDFFPSIEAGRIWNRLQHPPFNLTEKTGRKDIANTITWLCCHEMEVERLIENKWELVTKNVLPQGAPTSPTLTNIICQQLDFYFTAVARSFGLKYSRYADDITFSSMHNVYQKNSVIKNKKGQTFLEELHRITAEQKFHIKESKTRLQKDAHRQMVTGLVVNEQANVHQQYVKQLRMWLYYWEQYGYERAYSIFLQQYITDKGHIKKGKPDMSNVIAGKLDYLKMVKGKGNGLYLKLSERFANCLGNAIKIEVDQDALDFQYNNKIRTLMIETLKRSQQAKEAIINADVIKKENLAIKRNLISDNFKEIHDPKRLANLLSLFTLDSSAIKYSTHPIEKPEQFEDFNQFVSKFDEEELSEIKKLKSDLWNYLIYPFLFQRDDEERFSKNNDLINTFYWGNDKLKVGWKYKDILKNMFEKQQSNLYNQIFPLSTKISKEYIPEYRINGKYLNNWNDFVEIFKSEIEFRNNDFEKLIKSLTTPLNTNFNNNIEIKDLTNLNFYTYTVKIKEALNLLIHPFNDYAAPLNPKLIIEGKYNSVGTKKIVIRIINVNSYWDAILDEEIDKVSLKSGKGQIGHIKRLLYGLCDWSLETRLNINNERIFCRINYLGANYKDKFIEKNIKKIIGHTHVLTFYI